MARKIEEEIVPACLKYGIGMIPLRPLGQGLLTGKYGRGKPETDSTRQPWAKSEKTFDLIEAMESYAAKRGVRLLDVAIGGLLAQPGMSSLIAGATTADQVRANVA